MDETETWALGVLITLFSAITQVDKRLEKIEKQTERLNVSASSILDKLEPIREATLAMQRAAAEIKKMRKEKP